jgi:2-hydroxychromene-2-carboxylate isomerase
MTRRSEIEFIFDFGSPNAYLVLKTLPSLAQRTGADIRITPCLLGGIFKATHNQPPFQAFGQVQGKLAYEALETRRFIARHGLDLFKWNPHFPMNTLLIMRGLVAAFRRGESDRYLETVAAAMWERELKMDDPGVIRATLAEAGLDADAYSAAMEDPSVKAELADNTRNAVERGVFGIPTFFVGAEMFFGKERLPQIEEMVSSGTNPPPSA